MSGEKLPALLKKHANTYFICKKDKNRMHVGLWNVSPDPILSPKVELDKAYELESVYGENKELQGEICGNILRFNASIAPYSFVFFTVKG
jgi:hypothetical protein